MNTPRAAGGSGWRRAVPGAAAVAAVYVYFLLYAQYGFLRLLGERAATAGDVQRAMGAMGVTGLLVSLGAARLLRRVRAVAMLRAGLAGGGAAALAALACRDLRALTVVAAVVGASTALATVALASRLRTFLAGASLGLGVGAGTGTAYLLCNVPLLFEGSPWVQAVASALACLAGLGATRFLGREDGAEPEPSTSERPALAVRDFTALGFAAVVVAFLALVWLDSAAFAVIQESAALKGATWGGNGKVVIGLCHLLAAVAAGWLIGRGAFHGLLLATFGLFVTAFHLLTAGGGTAAVAGPLYAVGISFYSVALVVYPSYRGDRSDATGLKVVPRHVRSAVLYGVAGWLGSALGVGMAQELHTIPPALTWTAGVLLVVAWLLHGGRRYGRWLVRLAGAHTVTLLFGLAAAVVYLPSPAAPPAAPTAADAAAERGRRVYVEEGCINCHSQYVRPSPTDVALWGPRPALDDASGAADTPPLYGNRRQGPDLTNAGARRSATWHRLHLRDPRALSPGSRMPSYAHLFSDTNRGDANRGDASRGDDLVAYLASLGAEARDERYAQIQAYPLGDTFRHGSAENGARLFARYCAVCHGAGGGGDGPLAPALYRPAMDLTKGAFWDVSWGPDAEPEELALARVVKFGIAGTSMPGHESLADREVADLVAWVRRLNQDRGRGNQIAVAQAER